MKDYKILWKSYRASELTTQEPTGFEDEITKLAKEGWEVKSSSAVAIKIAAVDWIMLYALMEKEK